MDMPAKKAGRPAKGRTTVTLCLSPESIGLLKAWAERECDGNMSDAANAMMVRATELREPETIAPTEIHIPELREVSKALMQITEGLKRIEDLVE